MPDHKGNEHRSNGQGRVKDPNNDGRLKNNRQNKSE